MTFRCRALTEANDDVRAAAAKIASPRPEIEWTSFDRLQCKLEDVPHDFHAAFLRTGAHADPDSDVYLCWRDGSSEQWLQDVECCMGRPDPMDTGCTIFKGHPGRCDWQYIDPEQVALQAQADQLIKSWGLSHLFKSHG